MSYILDALKQSETKRKQESPPNPAAAVATARPKRPDREGGRLKWLLLLLAIVAALVWWQKTPYLEPAVETAAVDKTTPAPAPQPPVTKSRPAPEAVPATATAPAVDDDDLRGVRIQVQEPVVQPVPAATSPASTPQRAVAVSRPQSSPVQLPIHQVEAAAPAQTAPANDYSDVPYWRQLPVDVQRSLPELKFSVHIYSEDPASRRVKVGERMLREGQQITPQVRLEKIIPKGVILSYQDYRFRMSAL